MRAKAHGAAKKHSPVKAKRGIHMVNGKKPEPKVEKSVSKPLEAPVVKQTYSKPTLKEIPSPEPRKVAKPPIMEEQPDEVMSAEREKVKAVEATVDTDPRPEAPVFSGNQQDFPAWVRADMTYKEALGNWMARHRKAG